MIEGEKREKQEHREVHRGSKRGNDNFYNLYKVWKEVEPENLIKVIIKISILSIGFYR